MSRSQEKTLEMELISKLIRSLRHYEQGKSWEPGSASGCANQDESEWSLNTTLMPRFEALFPELAGRSLRRMFPL